MKTVAFLTKDNLDNFSCDDDLAIPACCELGINIETISWWADEDWSRFDAVIIRSTWDYQDHYDKFLEVLEKISSQTLLLNGLQTVKWNAHKSYLKELQQAGHKIIPTLFHEKIQNKTVSQLCAELKAEKIIFKPYVGANSDNTYPCIPGDEVPAVSLNDFFVQPFVESVLTKGEYSLFFFNGEYSHAILKTPKKGDYRVQEEWGGEITKIEPEQKLLKTAQSLVNPELLYNRVDLVFNKDEYQLMELEQIEPALYFRMDPGSEIRFAKALEKRLLG